MILRKADKQMEQGAGLPSKELLGAIGNYYQSMRDAGILLGGEWLQPSANSSRIVINKGKQTVVDGPFTELKELVAGFIVINVPSREEALAWAQKCPTLTGECDVEVEIRQLIEASDFPADYAEELTKHASKTMASDAEKNLQTTTVG
ncbi:YciI family protein [Edaphobacter sp. 12200R-103]|uniref:YciI family protein n=1 Tax=Edaphobacter sp. 12200R-103 TaxID=2703788 RepID=UPI00192E96BC|nr:YciI family protein [Edaphobacter sp. 12200R-103]